MFWLGVRLDRTFLTSHLVQKTIKTYFSNVTLQNSNINSSTIVYMKIRMSISKPGAPVLLMCWQGCIQALSAQLLSLSSVTLDTCYQSYPHLPTRTPSISSPAVQISCPLLSIIIGLLPPPNLVISERLISLLYRFYSSSTKTTLSFLRAVFSIECTICKNPCNVFQFFNLVIFFRCIQ